MGLGVGISTVTLFTDARRELDAIQPFERQVRILRPSVKRSRAFNSGSGVHVSDEDQVSH